RILFELRHRKSLYIYKKFLTIRVKKFTPLFFLLLFLLMSAEINSQGLNSNNWYFGNSPQGIRFNKSDNQPFLLNNQGTPFGTGGSAVATDPITGDLLFYTDGDKV